MTAPFTPLVSLRRITVSIDFYKLVFKYFPAVKDNEAYEHLLWYLLWGAYFDKHSARLLLCAETLAKLAGKPLLNFEAGDFLRAFDKNVLGGGKLICTNYQRDAGKCRQLLKLKLGDFYDVFEAEKFKKWHKFGRVYLDGQKFSEGKASVIRREQQHDAEFLKPQCEDAAFIQKYLHQLPLHLFTENCKKNYPWALKCASETLLPEHQQREFRILKYIDSQPKPFYSASEKGNSVRLFTSESIPNLARKVRKVFTKDWLEGDLKCSQLAIVAALWRVDSVIDLLKEKINFWTHLLTYLEIPEERFEVAKPILKDAIYALCFGQEERHIRSFLTREFNRINIPERSCEFVTEPHLHALLKAREKQIAQITEAGGARTYYGKELLVNEELQARDILAQMAQAIEMKIIYPVFKLAAAHPKEFKLMIYLFDGFCVHFHRYEEKWKERIKNVVDKQAKELGVPTYLEWDE